MKACQDTVYIFELDANYMLMVQRDLENTGAPYLPLLKSQ